MGLFNRSIDLTAYTYDPSYFETCPPVYQPKDRPSWLQKLKNFEILWDNNSQMHVKSPTVGVCPGVRDYLGLPINIYMWADLQIKINPDETWSYYTRPDWNVNIVQHSKTQFGEAYNKRLSLKLESPLYFVSDSPINYIFTESHYSTSFFRDREILLPPGITNFKYQHSTNVHLSVPVKEESYVIYLKHGTPLVSLFPMTERNINFQVKRVEPEEYRHINEHFPKMFIGRYTF